MKLGGALPETAIGADAINFSFWAFGFSPGPTATSEPLFVRKLMLEGADRTEPFL